MEHAGDVIPQLAAAAPGNEFVAYFASLLPWFFKRMVSFRVMALPPPPLRHSRDALHSEVKFFVETA